jgi:hypothetical protein
LHPPKELPTSYAITFEILHAEVLLRCDRAAEAAALLEHANDRYDQIGADAHIAWDLDRVRGMISGAG